MNDDHEFIVVVDIVGRTNFFSERLAAALDCRLISRDEEKFSHYRNQYFNSFLKTCHYFFNILKVLYIGLPKFRKRTHRAHFIFNIPRNLLIEYFLIKLLLFFEVRCHLILHNSNIHHDANLPKAAIARYLNSFHTVFTHCDTSMKYLKSEFSLKGRIARGFLPFLYSDRDAHQCWTSKNSHHLNIVFIGSDRPYKNLDVLLQAIGVLPEKVKENIRLSILGNISTKNHVLARNLLVNFTWHSSWIDDQKLLNLIGKSSLVVLPYQESSGSAALTTAFGLGRPYIASDVPYFKEFQDYFGGGVLFNLENGVEKLACHLLACSNNTEIFPPQRNSHELEFSYYANTLKAEVTKND